MRSVLLLNGNTNIDIQTLSATSVTDSESMNTGTVQHEHSHHHDKGRLKFDDLLLTGTKGMTVSEVSSLDVAVPGNVATKKFYIETHGKYINVIIYFNK